MNTLKLIKKLQSLNRAYFTTADLQKVTGLPRASLKVTLSRLVDKEVLVRLKRGVYTLSSSLVDVAKVANQLYYPSYLSFESALSRYGILSQIPYTQTFATPRPPKRMTLWETEIEFRQIKKDLFFGYRLEKGILLAEPEKALLDQLYLMSRGKATLNFKELDLREIDKNKLKKYAKKFPSYIQPLVKKVGGI